MPRNNVLWILVLAGVGSIERDESTSREKRIPEFFLQFLYLSFKICNESRLFLEFSRSDYAASGMVEFGGDLGRARRMHDGRGQPDA